MNLSPTEASYVRWLSQNAPGVIPAFKESLRHEMIGTIAPTQSGGIVDKLFGFAQTFTQYKAQRDVIKAQMDRARMGLPAMDTSQISMPPIRIETEVGRDTRSAMIGGMAKAMPIMILGGIGLIIYLTRQNSPRKRR